MGEIVGRSEMNEVGKGVDGNAEEKGKSDGEIDGKIDEVEG